MTFGAYLCDVCNIAGRVGLADPGAVERKVRSASMQHLVDQRRHTPVEAGAGVHEHGVRAGGGDLQGLREANFF